MFQPKKLTECWSCSGNNMPIHTGAQLVYEGVNLVVKEIVSPDTVKSSYSIAWLAEVVKDGNSEGAEPVYVKLCDYFAVCDCADYEEQTGKKMEPKVWGYARIGHKREGNRHLYRLEALHVMVEAKAKE